MFTHNKSIVTAVWEWEAGFIRIWHLFSANEAICYRGVLQYDSGIVSAIGSNMTLHRNIAKELMPTAAYNKQQQRWRVRSMPRIATRKLWQSDDERNESRYSMNRDQREMPRSQTSNSRPGHYDVRPPSAYSESIILKPNTHNSDWLRNKQLDTAKVIHQTLWLYSHTWGAL